MKKKGTYNFIGNFIPGNPQNQPDYLLNRWQKPGDIAAHQRFNSNYNLGGAYFTALSSDANLTDASFIRLKNLSLSWQFPKGCLDKAHLNNARIYVQGQNLFTITKYRGYDPETQSSMALPPLRVITFGLQIVF
jgi:hypothetical protein